MPLTLKKCLSETFRIWSALSEDSRLSRDNIKGTEDYDHNCPCCEYVTSRYTYWSVLDKISLCEEHCPLIDFWGGEENTYEVPCMRPNSLYERWLSTRGAIKQAYAFRIACAAYELYKERPSPLEIHLKDLKKELDTGILQLKSKLSSIFSSTSDALSYHKYEEEEEQQPPVYDPTRSTHDIARDSRMKSFHRAPSL